MAKILESNSLNGHREGSKKIELSTQFTIFLMEIKNTFKMSLNGTGVQKKNRVGQNDRKSKLTIAE